MKRYAITVGWSGRQNEPTRSIKEAPDGEWVRYEDAHEVQKERERDSAWEQYEGMKQQRDEARQQQAALREQLVFFQTELLKANPYHGLKPTYVKWNCPLCDHMHICTGGNVGIGSAEKEEDHE